MTDRVVDASPQSAEPPAPGRKPRPDRHRRPPWRPLARSVVVVAGLALAGYAVAMAFRARDSIGMLAWFAGSVIGHDLLLFPAYACLDRVAVVVLSRPSIAARLPVSPLNHLRAPTIAGLLLFCLSFPGIARQGAASYLAATGQTQQPFLGRWLAAVGVMFLVSGLLYAIRLAVARRRLDPQTTPNPEGPGGRVARTRG